MLNFLELLTEEEFYAYNFFFYDKFLILDNFIDGYIAGRSKSREICVENYSFHST